MAAFRPPVFAVKGDRFRSEHASDDLQRLVEGFLPLFDRREVDPELAELRFVPTDADPEDEAAVADVIDIAGQPGDHRWVAVVNAIDDRAESDPVRLRGDRGEMDPGFGRVAGVIADEERVESELFGEQPCPKDVLRRFGSSGSAKTCSPKPNRSCRALTQSCT